MTPVYVTTKLGGPIYECRPVPDKALGIKYKCGNCKRGVLIPPNRVECRVCKARVTLVEDPSNARPTVPPRGHYSTHVVSDQVRHGWNVVVQVRALGRMKPEEATVLAWQGLSAVLREHGIDLQMAVARLDEVIEKPEDGETPA